MVTAAKCGCCSGGCVCATHAGRATDYESRMCGLHWQAVDIPTYSERHGWRGGDKDTLYAITDKRTGNVMVRPVRDMHAVGPDVDVRVATRDEAEQHWQRPLNSGWKVNKDNTKGE